MAEGADATVCNLARGGSRKSWQAGPGKILKLLCDAQGMHEGRGLAFDGFCAAGSHTCFHFNIIKKGNIISATIGS